MTAGMTQAQTWDARLRPAQVVDAVQFDLQDHDGRRSHRIQVYQPAGEPPADGWPTVWFLDGGASFGTAATQMWIRAGMELQPALIVGIGYPTTDRMETHWARALDLTPATPPDRVPTAFSAGQVGGAEAFRDFLVDELRPLMAARWPMDGARHTLFGYSLGGLFTLDALFRRPDAFSAYVAASPSIWWGNELVLDQAPGFIARVNRGEAGGRLLLTAGSLEETPADWFPGATPEALAAHRTFVAQCEMIGRARRLAERLAAEAPALETRFILVDGEGHGGGPPAAVVRTLEFALAYETPAPEQPNGDMIA